MVPPLPPLHCAIGWWEARKDERGPKEGRGRFQYFARDDEVEALRCRRDLCGPRYTHWERQRCPLAVERVTYHALLAGLQALLGEDYVGALTIVGAPAFIALLRQSDHPDDPNLQRLRRHAVQLLNGVRGELTLHEQLVAPPLRLGLPRRSRPVRPPVATHHSPVAGAADDIVIGSWFVPEWQDSFRPGKMLANG
jgi:hypothetical protein